MQLSFDCWRVVLEWLCCDGIEHIAFLRLTSTAFRSLCDHIFFRELKIDLNQRQDRYDHYMRRLLDIHDDLRYHIRHLRLTSNVHIHPDLESNDRLVLALEALSLRDVGCEARLKSLSWFCAAPVPSRVVDALESFLPATRLYVDYRRMANLQPLSTELLSERQLQHVTHLKRLGLSPNLYSFSSFAKSKPTLDPEDHGVVPSIELVKQLLRKPSGVRELQISLSRPQDDPYFSIFEGEDLLPLESLGLDLSRTLHGMSYMQSLASWAQKMNWTALRRLNLESVSQSQCEALCTEFRSKLPALQELSIAIVGSIGPVGNSLVEALSRFLDNLDALESLSLIADMPNNHHLESIIQRPRLRRLIHRYPSSFLVSRNHFIALCRLMQLRNTKLEYLSTDLDLYKCCSWMPQELDLVATFKTLVELDITAHLRPEQFELLDPKESIQVLEQAFAYINTNKAGRKLQTLTGTFRAEARRSEVNPEKKYWEVNARCSLNGPGYTRGEISTRILSDQREHEQIREIISAERHRMISQHKAAHIPPRQHQELSSKRRRSRPWIPSRERSIEAATPLLDSVGSSASLDDEAWTSFSG